MANGNSKSKPLQWVGTSKKDIRSFPTEVKEVFGFDLHNIELGLAPISTAKALKGNDVKGVLELKKRFDNNTYRLVYIVKLKQSIYILHCFQKKSSTGIKTPQKDMNIVKARLQVAIEHNAKLEKEKKNGK